MKKILPILLGGFVVVAGIVYISSSKQKTGNSTTPQGQANTASATKTSVKRPMLGEQSFGLAVCDEFPKDKVEETIGKPIEETEDNSSGADTGCTYYTNKAKLEHVLIQVSYLSAENQKKGQEVLGRKIITDGSIPMENFIAMQEDGQINAIYLVMAPGKFVRVDRTANAADNNQLTALAVQVAHVITGN